MYTCIIVYNCIFLYTIVYPCISLFSSVTQGLSPTPSSQGDVHRDLGQPLLEKALEGYNATIFAYGQVTVHLSHGSLSAFRS